MKKILIVGWSKNEMVHGLYSRLKARYGNDISFDLFSLTELGAWETIPYDKIIEATVQGLNNKWINKIPKLRSVVYTARFKKEFERIYKDYDYIHFHYMFVSYNKLNKYLSKFKGKVIATVWGSDFYRKNKNDSTNMLKFYERVNLFTFANPSMRKDFFGFYNEIEENYLDIRFGLSIIEDKIYSSKISSKDIFYNIPSNMIKIYIGTNASRNQQHIKIIKELNKLSKEIKDKLFLVIPLTYGLVNKYEKEIQYELSKIKISHILMKEFMNDHELRVFRQSCDILLQLQTTDALSGAMQEHLYFNSIVITGSWLPYEIFEENDIYYHKITDFNEISNRLLKIITNFSTEKERSSINITKIKELSSWEANIDKWYSCY